MGLNSNQLFLTPSLRKAKVRLIPLTPQPMGKRQPAAKDSTAAVETSVRTDSNYRECNGNENEKLEHAEERVLQGGGLSQRYWC